MAQAPDDAARLAALEDFVTPRWQALRLERAGAAPDGLG